MHIGTYENGRSGEINDMETAQNIRHMELAIWKFVYRRLFL
jgi:hypothetical protein